jgi:hypothetical protein
VQSSILTIVTSFEVQNDALKYENEIKSEKIRKRFYSFTLF